jgi:hypothetical protein
MCALHYQRSVNGTELEKPLRNVSSPGTCFVPGCSNKYNSKGMCSSHRNQLANGRNLTPVRPKGNARWLTAGGYTLVSAPGHPNANAAGKILEHRLVMSRHLGRKLLREENVHHINGVKTDNRLANLELWTTSQPVGQRVIDRLAWARQLLATYAGDELLLIPDDPPR